MSRSLPPSSVALPYLLISLAACSGSDGSAGSPGSSGPQPTPRVLGATEIAPDILLTDLCLSGATGPQGSFLPGDFLTVEFRIEKQDGSAWSLSEMTSGEALVSGPTFSYQRVLPLQADVIERGLELAPGHYRYTFEDPLPAVYRAPYNDTRSFGPGDGERTGEALLDGTYTLGLSFAWEYSVEGARFARVGETTFDFKLGDAPGNLVPREVSLRSNCNTCHVSLRAHDGRYRELAMCLLCHTNGAEDRNDPEILDGTPGVTIAARVLFHKLHNGEHLPSVLGVGTAADGSRDYARTPQALQYVRGDGSIADYSEVSFPAFPNRRIPMPRDLGHAALTIEQQELEDEIRRGVTSCFACHFDPDAEGPLPAPSQGATILAQPSRAACGACHDDIDWTLPYVANLGFMDPQPDDSGCAECHQPGGLTSLSLGRAHLHPLRDPEFDPGIVFDVLSISDGNGGTLQRGDPVFVTFRSEDSSGAVSDPSQLSRLHAVVSGPAENLHRIHECEVPAGLVEGPGPFTVVLPERAAFELVGSSTPNSSETFATEQAPHRVTPSTPTEVWRQASVGASTRLAAEARRFQNFCDVQAATGFSRDDFVHLDPGGLQSEVRRITLVEEERIWFEPPLDHAHATGEPVRQATFDPLTEGLDYTLDVDLGQVTELVEFGSVPVLLSYTRDFLWPDAVPPPANDSPELDAEDGEWTGTELPRGTYRLGLWGSREAEFFFFTEGTTYTVASRPAVMDFEVGEAGVDSAYALIDSGESCQACHKDLSFHGGRHRGFDTCILCHGAAGAEDRPRSVAANAPETSGVAIGFRTLLHRIHRGAEGDPNFQIVGAGDAAFPDNFEVSGFEGVFPPQPGRSRECAVCHGESNEAWREPSERLHPTALLAPTRAWREACVGCHDSAAAKAHFEIQTSSSGVEACAVCHGDGADLGVERVHRVRR